MKHAYLIIAHNDFQLLEILLKRLDDIHNDFYIHIDKKVKNFDFDYYKKLVKSSNIYFIDRIDIQWASFNMIKTELELFKKAYEKGYDYYHLLSGCDLPIKSKEEILQFFENNPDTEFINIIAGKDITNPYIKERFEYYYLLSNYGIKKKKAILPNRIMFSIQRRLGVNRYKNRFEYGFGSGWVSLSSNGIKTILDNQEWIYKTFKYTYACDEIYLQTVILNNPQLNVYKQGKDNANMRYIIWSDEIDHPNILTLSDYEDIRKSECLFARKFSSKDSKELIAKMYGEC